MKAQLILLDTPIIVSDEEIKEGDWYIDDIDMIRKSVTSDKDYWDRRTDYKKIIAGIHSLPSIDFNGFEEQFGIVDVEKLALIEYPEKLRKFSDWSVIDINKNERDIWIAGFKAAQSLNKKKYSLEDIEKSVRYGFDVGFCSNSLNKTKNNLQSENSFIQSLSQPKVFDVEIEMKRERLYTNDGLDYEGDLKPKITNNQIKIINVCM